MARRDYKEIYIKREEYDQLVDKYGKNNLRGLIRSRLLENTEDINDILNKRSEEVNKQYETLFFELNKIMGLYISLLNNSSLIIKGFYTEFCSFAY